MGVIKSTIYVRPGGNGAPREAVRCKKFRQAEVSGTETPVFGENGMALGGGRPSSASIRAT
jgi:hypothetical protein